MSSDTAIQIMWICPVTLSKHSYPRLKPLYVCVCVCVCVCACVHVCVPVGAQVKGFMCLSFCVLFYNREKEINRTYRVWEKQDVFWMLWAVAHSLGVFITGGIPQFPTSAAISAQHSQGTFATIHTSYKAS